MWNLLPTLQTIRFTGIGEEWQPLVVCSVFKTVDCRHLAKPLSSLQREMIWAEFAPSPSNEGSWWSNCFGRGHRQLNQQEDQRCAGSVVLRWNLWPGTLGPCGSHCWKNILDFPLLHYSLRKWFPFESESSYACTTTQPLHFRFYLFVLSTRSW